MAKSLTETWRDRASWLPWASTVRDKRERADASSARPGINELGPRFRLLRELGRGGMGVVYLAYDRELGQEVALKLLHTLTVDGRARLKAEFRSLANIVHPNLIDLYDLVVDEQACFFTMEFVAGTNIVAYVRAPLAQLDGHAQLWSRFSEAARQLALAINAIHGGAKLHRDVKPSNVLVTPAGRVVLLDFGLLTPIRDVATDEDEHDFAGTPAYMSPEQMWGHALSPAADWYGFGATLYEVISGQPPHGGGGLNGERRLRQGLKTGGLDVPDEISRLLARLLDPEPANRANADEVLAFFGGRGAPSLAPVAGAETLPSSLIGREVELDRLHQAFAAVRCGATEFVHVSGPSGIGKSSLVRAFLSELAAEAPIILSSRCHPQEAVAFNAIDGLIDSLARHLLDSPRGIDTALSPEQVVALLRVFPALSQVFSMHSEATLEPGVSAQQVRQTALGALRELLDVLANASPVVLWVDDAQWADRDSGFVLRELARDPAPAHLLVLLSYRAEDRAASAGLGVLEQMELGHSNAVVLTPLAPQQSLDVVTTLLGRDVGRVWGALESLVSEAGGSPFLLSELARYLKFIQPGESPPERFHIDEMLFERMRDLPEAAHQVLEVFSVAGAPLEPRVALLAAGLTEADRGLILNLERLLMLRATDVQQRTSEIYHHRIAEEVRRRMSDASRIRHHGAIGRALIAASDGNLLAAVDHFEAAADKDSVLRYILPAANQASRVLAFDRAAGLYRRALELGCSELERHELMRRLANALSDAGRGKEAGQALLDAAAHLRTAAGSDSEQIAYLHQKAAEQFIQTGHYDRGLSAVHAVLAELDVKFPRSRSEALQKATLLRAKWLVGGVRLPRRPVSVATAHDLRRFDALWSTTTRLAMVDYALTSYSIARCASDSLRLGDISRMVCALSLEGAHLTTLPLAIFQRRADRLLALAAELNQRESTPYDDAFLRGSRAVAHCFRCQFRDTVSQMDEATRILGGAAHGRKWEYGLWQIWAMIGLTFLGELKELKRRAKQIHADATQRDDRFAAQNACLGRPTTVWLAEDRPEYAIDQADRALAWSPPDYTSQHYMHYVSTVEADLYRGAATSAWERSLRTWPAHKQNYLLSVAFSRDELWHARARSALALSAELLRGGGTPSKFNVAELQRDASRSADLLEKHGLPAGRAWASLVRATLAKQRSNPEEARRHLGSALEGFEASEMKLYREGTRYCLGELANRGDSEQREQSTAFMSEQEIVNPRRMVHMLVAGFLDEPRATVNA